MHRRRFVAATIATLAASGPISALAQGPTSSLDGAEGFAAVNFLGSSDDDVRSVWVRVSRWPEAREAGSTLDDLIADAGSDLPDGEFSQTEPEELPGPDLPDGVDASLAGWTTIAGAAAFETGWALLAMRRDVLLWDILVGAADLEIAADLASELAVVLAERDITGGDNLASLLPDEDDLPPELSLESLVSTDAPLEQIPDATPE